MRFVVGGLIEEMPLSLEGGLPVLIYPMSTADQAEFASSLSPGLMMFFTADDHQTVAEKMDEILLDSEESSTTVVDDLAADREAERLLFRILDIFSYGFIGLVSLIAAANVFNTISSSIGLRRREFAMLKSVGMSAGDFRKTMRLEYLIYGFKSLLFGIPASVLLTGLIWLAVRNMFDTGFYVPWQSLLTAIGSIFLVMFISMFYAVRKLGKENVIDAVKNENL